MSISIGINTVNLKNKFIFFNIKKKTSPKDIPINRLKLDTYPSNRIFIFFT